jgi:hypothetical protein
MVIKIDIIKIKETNVSVVLSFRWRDITFVVFEKRFYVVLFFIR